MYTQFSFIETSTIILLILHRNVVVLCNSMGMSSLFSPHFLNLTREYKMDFRRAQSDLRCWSFDHMIFLKKVFKIQITIFQNSCHFLKNMKSSNYTLMFFFFFFFFLIYILQDWVVTISNQICLIASTNNHLCNNWDSSVSVNFIFFIR